jgi:AcrR family transcriptional regulator
MFLPKDVTGDGDNRRDALILAARELIEEGGLDSVNIRAVLARSGLARRAFYDHFAGKDDLLLGVFQNTLAGSAERIRALFAPDATPSEKLEFLIKSIVLGRSQMDEEQAMRGDRHGAALSLEHLRLAQSHPDQLRAAVRPLINLIAELMTEGAAMGAFQCGAIDATASLLYNLVSTTVHAEILASDGGVINVERRRRLANDIWAFCCNGIGAISPTRASA